MMQTSPAQLQRVSILFALVIVGAAMATTPELAVAAQSKTVWDGIYTEKQAERGAGSFTTNCARCHENAIGFARRAWDEREPAFILWARQFPHYRTLHSDPRFASILLEMNSAND